MSEVAQKFIDQLKQDNILEAMETIKAELAKRARAVVEEVSFDVAESFNMSKVAESEEEKDEDEDDKEDDDKEEKEDE